MKRFLMSFGALALLFAATSCTPEEENKGGNVNFDEIVYDGFYVYGDAVGAEEITAEYGMAAGLNEVDAAKRNGMYEKYIVLEANKDFFLVLNEAGVHTNYGATLEPYDVSEIKDNPSYEGTVVKRGELKIGADAPAMRVDETGLYHIVLDLNKEGDLLYPQIVVTNVIWGVRGAMNGWGFTPFEAVEVNAKTMTWTMTEVDIPAGGEFKFGYGHGWKIQLDDAGEVKANTNLGQDSLPNGANIKVEKGGLYTISLTYTLAGGDISKGYTYELVCTKESELPTEMYMTGTDFGNWTWGAEGIVSLTPVNSTAGMFWAVRKLTANNGIKFSSINVEGDWSKAFGQLTTNDGFTTDGDGNAVVAEDGLYLIVIDTQNSALTIKPAAGLICGLDAAFGGWEATNAGQVALTVNADFTATATATADGILRAFAKIEGVDAWKSEFSVLDGKIVYRGNGGDFKLEDDKGPATAVAVTAGQTVTFDFNAGTATIQ